MNLVNSGRVGLLVVCLCFVPSHCLGAFIINLGGFGGSFSFVNPSTTVGSVSSFDPMISGTGDEWEFELGYDDSDGLVDLDDDLQFTQFFARNAADNEIELMVKVFSPSDTFARSFDTVLGDQPSDQDPYEWEATPGGFELEVSSIEDDAGDSTDDWRTDSPYESAGQFSITTNTRVILMPKDPGTNLNDFMPTQLELVTDEPWGDLNPGVGDVLIFGPVATGPGVIPEPSAMVVWGTFGLGLLLVRRRRRL